MPLGHHALDSLPALATVDVHQHIWPAPLIDALRRRSRPPRLRGWTLELAGEPDYEVDPRDHDPEARAAIARADGLDRVLISLSAPLGIELLEGGEADELLSAYHEGVLDLPPTFGAWAAASLAAIDEAGLARQLGRGLVGLQLPANALLDSQGYERVRPLLEVLEHHDKPLFIHPGPAQPGRTDAIPWWPAMVDYVQQMHAAWFAFRAYGRPQHPRLRVLFAMLAGLAPLHVERFAARAGLRSVVDLDAFLELSSYGPAAIDAVVRVLGIDVLVNGSDRPYALPSVGELGGAEQHALRITNPDRLLSPKEVFHGMARSPSARP